MASNFSFPPLTPEQIAEALHTYGLAPTANLRAEDIANPQPDLLPAVISNFLATVVDPTGADDLDGQLGFDALASLDNPEHYREGIRVLRLHKRASAFLESIQFPGFTLRDLLRPDPRRLVQVLSALINFLYYRDDKLALLQPIIHEFPNLDERCMELKAKLAEIAKNDFELVKLAQENSKLLSKIVESPEKLQRALEEKKTARAELKNAEKIATQSVQEKTATLEIYSKLGFDALASLDNPEHYREGIRVLRLHKRANAFLESIQFPGFTLRDLLRPDQRRLVQVLSALINFLYYRDEKLALLQPIIHEFPNLDERCMELNAKIAEHQKAIADQELAAQMEVPMVQQLEAEVNSLKQKLVEYNKKQLALRANATAINDKKEETHRKVIAKNDFELVKLAQENSKLLSKIVESPEKLQRALEEKKTARAELKNAEKIATQSVQEKTATLEIYSKGYEKLSKHSTKIQALQEQVTATKALEKEVKARKTKISDESVEIMALDTKIIEWDGKVHEMEEHVKAKEKKKDQIVADENQKLAALSSEVEWKLKCLEPRERKVEETIAKFTCYKDNFKSFLEQVDEVSKETLESLDRQAVEPLDTSATL
uniref:Kinetochore protein Nuf2 N-terminal domain-containing protein n=1 Tax=Oryza nivara TaxID=4536 RepID=A0A0E0I7J8_ORYNI